MADNEKIVVIRNDNNEDDEIDLFRLIGIMFHNVIRLILITLAIGIVGAGTIYFIYNPSKTNYLCQFTYSIPSYSNSKLIDGTVFTVEDLAKESTLTYVKSSNKDFSSLDVNALVNKKGLKVEYVREYNNENDDEMITNSYYQLSIKTNAFSNSDQAKSFLTALVSYPLSYNLEAQKSLYYKTNFDDYNNANTYESKIDYLQNQLAFLNDKYNGIISNYGDIIFANNAYSGKKASTVLNEINQYFVNYSFSNLLLEISEEGYVFSTEEITQLQYEKKELNRKIEYNEQKISELKAQLKELITTNTNAQSYDISSYNNAISTLIQEKIDYQSRIDSINRKLHVDDDSNTDIDKVEAPASFKNTLATYYNYLLSATEDYQKYNEYEAMENYSRINFINSYIIGTEGGLSLIVTLAVPFAVGLLCGLIVNGICDRKYLKEPYPAKKKIE